MYRGEFHSRDYSMINRRVDICSVHDLSFRKPACSSRNSLSTSVIIISRRIPLNTFPGIDNNVMPLQFLQSFKLPFFGRLNRWHVSNPLEYLLQPRSSQRAGKDNPLMSLYQPLLLLVESHLDPVLSRSSTAGLLS